MAYNPNTNITAINGVAPATDSGVTGTGVSRVVLATNVGLPAGAAIIGALTANQSVNVAQMNGVATTMGNGVVGTGVQRVAIASDNSAFNVIATPVTPTPSNFNSAATTNATSLKASAGTLFGLTATNNGAAVMFLKLYNKASAPTVGTDVPILVASVPANGVPLSIVLGASGHRFATGIAYATTNLIADSDTTAIAASQCKAAFDYV